MINQKTIKDINDKTEEGKLLLMAISILTSIKPDDIKSDKWGGMVHPDDALTKVKDLANEIYYEEEYKAEKKRIMRDNKINSILTK
jgi:hypothetical protein